MSEVTVIGLGNMGSALARALLENGHHELALV
jgi:3-hydroxyisobutyrate dehydrogenase-like beta-hydroxyacid dehydrogenase